MHITTIESLQATMAEIANHEGDRKGKAAALRAILKKSAEAEGVELKLGK